MRKTKKLHDDVLILLVFFPVCVTLCLCLCLCLCVLGYAKEHHELIARFGRFPHRNALLGRENTPEGINSPQRISLTQLHFCPTLPIRPTSRFLLKSTIYYILILLIPSPTLP